MSSEEVVRPSIPPVAWFALGVWVGTVIAEQLAWQAYVGSGSVLVRVVPVLACSAFAAFIAAVRRGSGLALMLVGLCSGLLVSGVFWNGWAAQVERVSTGSVSRTFEATSDPATTDTGFRFRARETSGCAALTVKWPASSDPPEAGEVVSLRGVVQVPSNDEWGRRSHRSGEVGGVRAQTATVDGPGQGLRGRLARPRERWLTYIDAVPGPGGDLLAGVVLGDRRRLAGTQTDEDFRVCGLTHLVAVSGGHLVVVAALLVWLLRSLRTPRLLVAILTCGVLGIYVVASGVQPSAVRAWIMACVLASAGSGGRRGDGLASLSVAASLAVLTSPPIAFDLGFQLSVVAVAGLLTFGRLASCWLEAALPAPMAALSSPLGVTLIAQVVTVPLTAPVFGMVSLVAPLANLVAGPLVSGALTTGLIGLALRPLAPGLSRTLLFAAGAFGNATAAAAGWLASLPYAAIPFTEYRFLPIAVLGCAVIAWLVWPRPDVRRARAVAALCTGGFLIFVIAPRPAAGPEVTFLDVGQGDAVLVRDGSAGVLVDAGPDETVLRRALGRVRVRHVDALVLTHLHADHAAGAAGLGRVVPVGQVMLGPGALGSGSEGEALARRLDPAPEVLEPGDVVHVGRLVLEVLSPPVEGANADENDGSLVILVRAPSFSVLLTGDAESGVLERLLRQGTLGDIDVLKVGHHGSADSVSDGALEALAPEAAVISVGARNRFRHPVRSTLDLLHAADAVIYRTDRHGDVTVRSEGSTYRVICSVEP